ncbi:MAG TPA: hypothetical protein H9830_02665 [Candidatus Agrococcus pullicola]|uniref:Uncharacterized protein n=1 Tax=Candidatus Agrococcus pullicola TaxID=2838429 RepID=A0A9D2C8E3_9MICO|nr:hypothetical protein [Candidatus Agrococcus pullicola]
MRIELNDVSKGDSLPAISAVFSSGRATRIAVETEQRPTVLGLIASGRMVPDSGTVTIDDASDRRRLRRAVALVDAPGVSEPDADVTLGGLISEELMFAGGNSDAVAARIWARNMNVRGDTSTPLASLAPEERVRVLLELAAMREQQRGQRVAGLVLVSPDRHGGDPEKWWRIADLMARRGLAVLVITGRAADRVLQELESTSATETEQ